MANEVAKLIFKADTSDIESAIKRLGYLSKSANDAEKQVGQLGDDAKKASDKVKKLGDESGKAAKKQKGFGAAISNNKGKVLGLTVALTAMAVMINRGLKAVEQAGSEFSIFRARLITATGSVEAASKAFKDLNAFALETPFTLAESVNGFAKLTNLGLNPSRAAMVSFANTSAAMGGSLEQMIEAVADATTFEFERLKEFGIKSSQEGDKVKFTFRGVTTEINKSADEVSGYLENIGNTVFAGAAIEQTKTLKGSISNLEQAYGNLAIAAGEVSGANDVFSKSNNDLAAAISDPQFQEGVANLTTAFAEIKAGLVGISVAAVKGVVDFLSTTQLERAQKLVSNLETMETQLLSMHESQPTYAETFAFVIELEEKIRAFNANPTNTLQIEVAGLDTGLGFTGEFTGVTEKAGAEEGIVEDEAPTLQEIAAEAKQTEIDRIKALELEFQTWKGTLVQSELDIMKEQHLLKEEATQEHFDRLTEMEEQKAEGRNEMKADLDKKGFLQQASQGGNTLKFIEKMKKNELKVEDMTGKQKAKMAIGLGGDILAHAAKNSETAFKMQKGLKIATTIQDTYSAAMGAYSSLAPIPFVGPALGIAAAGMAIAGGMANVKAIQATQFNKSGGGGSVSKPSMPSGGGGGGISAASVAEIAPIQEASEDGEEVGAASVVNVTVDGSIDPSGARRIIEAINEATEDGLQINALVGT